MRNIQFNNKSRNINTLLSIMHTATRQKTNKEMGDLKNHLKKQLDITESIVYTSKKYIILPVNMNIPQNK